MSSRTESRCSLYLVRAPNTVDQDQLALLSSEERLSCGRLRAEAHRARYVCAHALLRQVLADQLGIAAVAVALQSGVNNRPQLAREHAALAPGLDFNLSSTPGYVACAIAFGVRVGVDVEFPKPGRHDAALLERVLTRRELAWYARSDDPQAFFRLWTLKEALAKAHGEGLGLAFDQIETLPRGDDGLDLNFDLKLDPNSNANPDVGRRSPGSQSLRWRLLSLATSEPQAGVPAALALAGPDTAGPIALNSGVPRGFHAVEVCIRAEGQTG